MNTYPRRIHPTTEQWLESNDIQLQRSILLFQLKYKTNSNLSILFNSILFLKDSKEFFIQKVIGWALREYSKVDSEKVIQFVESTDLAPLSKRESLKWIKSKNNLKQMVTLVNATPPPFTPKIQLCSLQFFSNQRQKRAIENWGCTIEDKKRCFTFSDFLGYILNLHCHFFCLSLSTSYRRNFRKASPSNQ